MQRVCECGEDGGVGGQEKGCRDQLIYHMPAAASAAKPLSCEGPLFVERRERVPFTARPKE